MKIRQPLKTLVKSWLVAGTAVMVPLIGTYLILKFIILSIDDLFISFMPENLHPSKIFGIDIPGVGLIATIAIILVVGGITRMYVGKTLVGWGDRIIAKIPLGRGIYKSIKQFVSAITSDKSKKFRSVAAVEYPRRGCWMIGFVTGDYEMQTGELRERMVSIFIPTTPNPTSGFLIYIPREDMRTLPISVEEAFKLIVSAGIVQEPSLDSHLDKL